MWQRLQCRARVDVLQEFDEWMGGRCGAAEGEQNVQNVHPQLSATNHMSNVVPTHLLTPSEPYTVL